MKLLDAAEVEWAARGNWERGWDGDSRACGGLHVFLSECDPDVTADVIGAEGEDGADCGYRVIPFGIVATLNRTVRMARDDDDQWLADQLKAGAEIPVSRGLLVRQGQGTALGETWIGSPDAEEIPAPTLTDNAAVATAVSDGRRAFFRRTIGLQPILHVNPGNALVLKNAGVLQLDPTTGDDRTVWGDPVVISEGYYDIPDLSAVPLAFWTGPIKIKLTDVNREDTAFAVRQNKRMHQATMIAAIDTLPCAIVRIGPAPAPTP